MKKILLCGFIALSTSLTHAGWLDTASALASGATKTTEAPAATAIVSKKDTFSKMNCADLEVNATDLNSQITTYTAKVKQGEAQAADPAYQNQQKVKQGAGMLGSVLSGATGNAGQVGQIANAAGSGAASTLEQDKKDLAVLQGDLSAAKVYQKHKKCKK